MFDLTSTLFPETPPCRLRPGPHAPLQQSGLYARASAMLGARVSHVTLPGSGALVVHRKMPLLGEVAMISRGPPDLQVTAAQHLRSVTRASHVIVHAEDNQSAKALAAARYWRIGAPRHIAEVGLDPCPDAMAARLDGKWRNRLRHALRQNLRVTRSAHAPATGHWLFSADALAGRALRYRPTAPVLVAALAAARPGASQLYVARKGGAPVAAMLFLRHGRIATYQIGWSTPQGRACSAGNLLMWRAMVDLSAMGADGIDLGHADPRAAPGLTRFKTGAGATIRCLGGSWLSSAILPFQGGFRAP